MGPLTPEPLLTATGRVASWCSPGRCDGTTRAGSRGAHAIDWEFGKVRVRHSANNWFLENSHSLVFANLLSSVTPLANHMQAARPREQASGTRLR
jgi:hypothetical protein